MVSQSGYESSLPLFVTSDSMAQIEEDNTRVLLQLSVYICVRFLAIVYCHSCLHSQQHQKHCQNPAPAEIVQKRFTQRLQPTTPHLAGHNKIDPQLLNQGSGMLQLPTWHLCYTLVHFTRQSQLQLLVLFAFFAWSDCVTVCSILRCCRNGWRLPATACSSGPEPLMC